MWCQADSIFKFRMQGRSDIFFCNLSLFLLLHKQLFTVLLKVIYDALIFFFSWVLITETYLSLCTYVLLFKYHYLTVFWAVICGYSKLSSTLIDSWCYSSALSATGQWCWEAYNHFWEGVILVIATLAIIF